MPPAEPHPRDRRWRRYFRRFRIALLLLALALVAGLIYLNQVGLPEMLRGPLLEAVRERGLDLKLSTLRLHFYRGIVAEDVRIGQRDDVAGPRFTAREAELNLSWPALARFELAVSGVGLRDGQLVLPIADTNEPGRFLLVEKIQAMLRFLPEDEWALENLNAVFRGANFSLHGNITNASAMRDWPLLKGEKVPRGDLAAQRLREFADTLKKIHCDTPPELRATLTGNARNLESFMLRLTVNAPDASTPWGKLTSGLLTVRLLPAAAAGRPHADLQLHAAGAKTPWGDVTRFNLGVRLQASVADTNLINADLKLDAAGAQTPWANVTRLNLNLHLQTDSTDTNLFHARATANAAQVITRWASVTNAQLTAQWLQALTNPIPLSAQGELRADAATSRWASAKSLKLSAAFASPPHPAPADPSWDWWRTLQPFELGWAASAARLDTEKVGADEVVCGGNWSAPLLQITNLQLHFPEGQFVGHGRLDVATRAADFGVQSDFNAKRLGPLLGESAQRWLARHVWTTPPHATGTGTLILPAWTNRAPDWAEEVLPTLCLAAQVAITNGSYLGLPADWATLHLSMTNLVWRLPDLVVGRPEGQLQVVHIADDKTHDFYFGIHSTVDPRIVLPLFGTNEQTGFDLVTYSQPPVIEGEVWGNWRASERLGARGHVTLTDFTFRGETASRLETTLRYTNRFLEFLAPRLERGAETATADGVAVDFDAQRVYLTNALCAAEPMVIARGIGPHIARAIEPYRFLAPPVVRVNGYAPLHGEQDADLRFDVDGGPFEWWQFKIPHIAGHVHWRGESLVLTNMHLTAYDGAAAGFANFDFRAQSGTDFQFNLGVTNVELRLLMMDLATQTNKLEGRLSGELVVTNANTEDKFSWDGYGNLQLRDGLIWAIPVFGVLSKPLDSLMPGLGSARIKNSSGAFALTNGVLFADTLEMRAPASRLLCHGTVDFDGRVSARVVADLPLRDPFGFSRILNLALWPMTKLFEYRVTGTINEPKAEPAYVPKVLLHPLRTFEEIFSTEPAKTNVPPPFKDAPKSDPPR